MELFSSMSSSISTVLTVFLVIVIVLYVLSIAYVVKDSRSRGASSAWIVISLIPLIGFIAYCVGRPQLTTEDRDEQELELALKRRQLMHYGECAHCGYPVEADYVLCPHCHQRLKNLCPTCHHALNPEWSICPYCTTQIHGGTPQGANRRRETRPSSADATGARRRID